MKNLKNPVDIIKENLYNPNCQMEHNKFPEERKVTQMSINAMESKVKELVELKKMAQELEDEITAIEDEIKKVMGEEEVLFAGQYKVSWSHVSTQRFDTSLFKKMNPTLAKDYIKTVVSRRFSVA